LPWISRVIGTYIDEGQSSGNFFGRPARIKTVELVAAELSELVAKAWILLGLRKLNGFDVIFPALTERYFCKPYGLGYHLVSEPDRPTRHDWASLRHAAVAVLVFFAAATGAGFIAADRDCPLPNGRNHQL
jgi:hypothetical protein